MIAFESWPLQICDKRLWADGEEASPFWGGADVDDSSFIDLDMGGSNDSDDEDGVLRADDGGDGDDGGGGGGGQVVNHGGGS